MIAGAANRHRFKIHFIKDYLEVKKPGKKRMPGICFPEAGVWLLIGLENLPALIQC